MAVRSLFCLFLSDRFRQVLLYIRPLILAQGNLQFCRLLNLFKINFLKKKSFRNTTRVCKQFGSRSGLTFCRARSRSTLFAKIIRRRHYSGTTEFSWSVTYGFCHEKTCLCGLWHAKGQSNFPSFIYWI